MKHDSCGLPFYFYTYVRASLVSKSELSPNITKHLFGFMRSGHLFVNGLNKTATTTTNNRCVPDICNDNQHRTRSLKTKDINDDDGDNNDDDELDTSSPSSSASSSCVQYASLTEICSRIAPFSKGSILLTDHRLQNKGEKRLREHLRGHGMFDWRHSRPLVGVRMYPHTFSIFFVCVCLRARMGTFTYGTREGAVNVY